MKRIKYRIILFLIIIFISTLGSLISSYAYGFFFSHARYWKGTIYNVESIEINLLKNILDKKLLNHSVFNDAEKLKSIFSPLDGKIGINIFDKKGSIFHNIKEYRQLSNEPALTISIDIDKKVVIHRYQPPSWNKQFFKWLKKPHFWAKSSYDFITANFVSFFIIHTLFLYAISWQIRVRHLENDVLSIISKYDKE